MSINVDAQKPKIIVSTDIGGSDPDDFQSMVHLLVYADRFEILGLISSPPHDGRVGHILEAIDVYEKDYPKLQRQNTSFPEPNYLRQVSKQGATAPL
ncbi:nucleoside hydrolase-like domain-containing protein, partial [Aquiflexum sp.]|uniref:nucleoside hydrolase-like domain-containing protein n=1 Tax=Aquiflexum sp. TaxID=1872584 RepID=UPI003593182B